MSSPNPREMILFWCISFAFGAGMLALLVAMCAAEISIHRDRSGSVLETREAAMDQ